MAAMDKGYINNNDLQSDAKIAHLRSFLNTMYALARLSAKAWKNDLTKALVEIETPFKRLSSQFVEHQKKKHMRVWESTRKGVFPDEKTKFDLVPDKWIYCGLYMDDPFYYCVCGNPTRFLHKLRCKLFPDHVVMLGQDCLNYLRGFDIASVGINLEALLRHPFTPIGSPLRDYCLENCILASRDIDLLSKNPYDGMYLHEWFNEWSEQRIRSKR